MAKAFEDVRIVDFTQVLCGPMATAQLALLGADVIKVESHYGDESRHLGPKRGTERSAYLSLNRSKRGVVLDLRRDRRALSGYTTKRLEQGRGQRVTQSKQTQQTVWGLGF